MNEKLLKIKICNEYFNLLYSYRLYRFGGRRNTGCNLQSNVLRPFDVQLILCHNEVNLGLYKLDYEVDLAQTHDL